MEEERRIGSANLELKSLVCHVNFMLRTFYLQISHSLSLVPVLAMNKKNKYSSALATYVDGGVSCIYSPDCWAERSYWYGGNQNDGR